MHSTCNRDFVGSNPTPGLVARTNRKRHSCLYRSFEQSSQKGQQARPRLGFPTALVVTPISQLSESRHPQEVSRHDRSLARAFLEAADGCSVTVRDSYIESGCDSVGLLQESPDRIVLDHCEINGGIDLGEGESVEGTSVSSLRCPSGRGAWTGDRGEDNVAYLAVDSSPGLEEHRR